MIVDLERDTPPEDFAAEVCIIGAGAAGIVLADELARRGRRVLLLESGGATLESAAQELNECMYSGQPHRAASIGRFRVLGGTTTAWGGQILEFTEEDFRERPWVPGSGWPFPKTELEPYYRRALQVEGLLGVAQTDADVWRQLGTAPPEIGEELIPYFTRWCPEPNFARLHRATLESSRVCVMLHATAAEFLLNGSADAVSGVRCRTAAGRDRVFSAAEYVLCLGTIESVRFLLQPFAGGQAAPWNRSGLLGRHFQSHMDYDAASVAVEDSARLRRWFANAYLRGYKYHPKFRLAFPLQQRQRLLNIAGSITCMDTAEGELTRIKSLARQAMRGRFAEMTAKDFARAMRQLPVLLKLARGYAIEHRAYWGRNSAFKMRVHCEQEPLSQSRIKLTGARDASGMLRAELDWKVSRLEWKTIRYFAEQVQQNFSARGLARLTLQPELLDGDGFRDVVFDNSHHDMGGSRMSSDPGAGIVSPDLQLHGIRNASVCSASVFPTSGFSNPTHTLVALALRLADRLINRAAAENGAAGIGSSPAPGGIDA